MQILIVGGSPDPSSPELVSTLVHASDYVIAADAGADVLRVLKLVPDVLCGDADSLSRETLLWIESHDVARTQVSWFKDDTDLGLALGIALEQAHKCGESAHITCTCVSGGRIDHLLGVFGTLRKAVRQRERKSSVAIVEDAYQCRVLHAHENWVLPPHKQGHIFSALALEDNTCLTEKGMLWTPTHSRFGVLDDRGVSNQIVAADASITCEEGIVAAILLEERASAEKQNLLKKRTI